MAGLGDSFMLPKPGQDTEHLWVLITRPNPQTHTTIMVNVTTQRPHSDTTTILNAGEHPFVQKPSVIFMRTPGWSMRVCSINRWRAVHFERTRRFRRLC